MPTKARENIPDPNLSLPTRTLSLMPGINSVGVGEMLVAVGACDGHRNHFCTPTVRCFYNDYEHKKKTAAITTLKISWG